MAIKVDWTFVAQSRLRMTLREFYKKNKVTTYDEAVKALQRNGIPVGPREAVAAQLPSTVEKSTPSVDSNPTTSPSAVVHRKKSAETEKKETASMQEDKEPKSEGEEAADAITKSAAVKAPKAKPARKRRVKSPKQKSNLEKENKP
tara:strand:+ start:746 stop:1183 length:438 start_codon:yes stop_codon:yes gene_type:complete